MNTVTIDWVSCGFTRSLDDDGATRFDRHHGNDHLWICYRDGRISTGINDDRHMVGEMEGSAWIAEHVPELQRLVPGFYSPDAIRTRALSAKRGGK